MESLFSLESNPDLDMYELDAMLTEFKLDYNQKHFVRNETFKVRAAWKLLPNACCPGIAFKSLYCMLSHIHAGEELDAVL